MRIINSQSHFVKEMTIQPGRNQCFIAKKICETEKLGSMPMSFSYGERKPKELEELDDQHSALVD